MQNLRNFLISFAIGLVVFGICAVILIHYGTKKIVGGSENNTNNSQSAQQTDASEESDGSNDIEYTFDDSESSAQ